MMQRQKLRRKTIIKRHESGIVATPRGECKEPVSGFSLLWTPTAVCGVLAVCVCVVLLWDSWSTKLLQLLCSHIGKLSVCMRQFQVMDSRDRSLCHNSGVQLIWQPVAPRFLAPRFITWSLVLLRVQTAGTRHVVVVQPVAPGFLAPRFTTRSLVFVLRVQTAGTGQKVAVRATRLKEYMGKNRISNVSASTMQNFFKPMNRDD